MIEPDTVRLLRECNAGIKMGINALEEVLPKIKQQNLKSILQKSLTHHQSLEKQTQNLLENYGDDGKQPHPMAEAMAQFKTRFQLQIQGSDQTAASLLTTGSDMGVKSLSRYLNQYAAADEISKNIAKELIEIETLLSKELRDFL